MSEVIRYIHSNPVARGLVSQPEDYPWSSFRGYATGHLGTVETEADWLASRRDRAAKTHSSRETKAR